MQIVVQKTTARDERGFTLIELLITIAIIGILAAIAIPQFSQYGQRALRASMQADARNTVIMEEATFSDTQSYMPIATTAPGASFTIGSQSGRMSAGNTLTITQVTTGDYTITVNNPNAAAPSANYSQDNDGNTGFY